MCSHLASQPATFQYPTRKRTSSQPIFQPEIDFFARRLAAPRDFPSRDGASQPVSNIGVENEANSSAGFPMWGFQDTKSDCTGTVGRGLHSLRNTRTSKLTKRWTLCLTSWSKRCSSCSWKVGDLQAVMAAHAISKMWQAQVLVVSCAN